MSVDPAPDPAHAQAQMRGIVTAAMRPISHHWRRLLVATVAASAIGVVAQLALGDWAAAFAVNVVAALLAFTLALVPLRDARLRHAIEEYSDHLQVERDEWKLFTGTSMPLRPAAMERWLSEHPESRYGRPALFVGLGRFAEAEAELRSHPALTAAEAYEHELLRQQARVYQGSEPDMTVLLRDLSILTPAEQRHRRKCLAALESYRAAVAGGDALQRLADGRDPRGPVHLRARWWAPPLLLFAIAVYPSLLAIPIRLLLD